MTKRCLDNLRLPGQQFGVAFRADLAPINLARAQRFLLRRHVAPSEAALVPAF